MSQQTSEHVVVLDGGTLPGREAIGNKGASLARMLGLGLPVPPAFVLPIDECRAYDTAGGTLSAGVWTDVLEQVTALERKTGRRFNDASAPLLVSVRSGAAVSMPGMMDTVLNLGMTDAVERGLSALSGDAAFARQTHVRFCHEFGATVLGADLDPPGPDADPDAVRAAVLEDTGQEIPEDPAAQLRAAIHAVFGSWSSRRATAYRRHWGMSQDGGTAVIVQAMVFGNLGGQSGTGVLFTRNPLDGQDEPYGEWLPGGQGEDVVSGTHDCLPLTAMAEALPDAHDALLAAGQLLEREHGDVQDVEFTVEDGQLFLLQTRAAKRAPLAAVRTAVELADAETISRRAALHRVTPEQLTSVLAPRLSAETAAAAELLAEGSPACPGVAGGIAVDHADAAEAATGDTVLVRPTTSPEDVAGMIAATGVVTEKGGSTSHAAVVSRALGRPSVVGVGVGVAAELTGREITINGSTGKVYAGRLTTEQAQSEELPGLDRLIAWARELSPVAVVEEAPELLDLDGVDVGADGRLDATALAERLRGVPAVRGAVLATPEGVGAVLAAGVPTVVLLPGQHDGPLLLRFAQQAHPEEETTP